MHFLYVPGWKSYSSQLSGVPILHFLMPETKTANHTIMTLHVRPGPGRVGGKSLLAHASLSRCFSIIV